MTKNEIIAVFKDELEKKALAIREKARLFQRLTERDWRYDNYHGSMDDYRRLKDEMYVIRDLARKFGLEADVLEDFSVIVSAKEEKAEPCYYEHSELLAHKDEIIKAAQKKFAMDGTRTSRDGHNGYWMDITDWTDEDEYRYLLDLKNNQLCLYRKKAGNKAFVLEDTDSLDDPYTLEELQDHLR